MFRWKKEEVKLHTIEEVMDLTYKQLGELKPQQVQHIITMMANQVDEVQRELKFYKGE